MRRFGFGLQKTKMEPNKGQLNKFEKLNCKIQFFLQFYIQKNNIDQNKIIFLSQLEQIINLLSLLQAFILMRSSQNFNSIEVKQAYVYDNIFQGDYDIQAFAEYLAQQGPKYTSNLEQLTYDQIKTSVDAFVDKHQSPKAKDKHSERESYSSESQMNRMSVDYTDMEFYMKTRECVKEINKFALTSIQLNIISFRKNQGKFFSRDFITFKIDLPQLHKQIDRRYSNFQWLRSILTYYHPGVVIPPLPKKKMKKIFTENHLKKKGRMLQNFLRKCLQIPDLRNDENLYRFLTIQSPQKFEQHVKENKPQKGMAPFEKIKSSTGQIEFGINEQSIRVNKAATEYFQKLTPFMKEFYKEIKRVKQNLDACSGHLENLETLSKKFAPTEEQFRRQCNRKDFYEDQQREKSFIETMSVLAEKYKQQLKQMKEIWQKELYAKMKYEFHHSQSIMSFINDYRSEERSFYSMKESLKKKKLKIFSKPMSDWGLPQDKVAKFMNEKPSFNEVAPHLLLKKTEQTNSEQLTYALKTKQLSNSIIHYAKYNNLYNMRSVQRFLQKQHALQADWSYKLKDMITTKFEFSLVEINSAKDRLLNTGSSIKGFFSQFNNGVKEKGSEKEFKSMIQSGERGSGPKEVGDVYNGL